MGFTELLWNVRGLHMYREGVCSGLGRRLGLQGFGGLGFRVYGQPGPRKPNIPYDKEHPFNHTRIPNMS